MSYAFRAEQPLLQKRIGLRLIEESLQALRAQLKQHDSWALSTNGLIDVHSALRKNVSDADDEGGASAGEPQWQSIRE